MGRIRTTLDKPTRTQAVTEAIRRLIVDGDLAPGSRLQGQMLADRLSVSRTPVQESLKALADEGLVCYEPHCGFTVRSLDASDVEHAFDTRMVLEGHAARTVATMGLDDATVALVERNFIRCEEVLHGSKWNDALQDEWFRLNWQFHDANLARAANPFLTRTVMQLRQIPRIYSQTHRVHTRAELVKLYRREQSQKALAHHKGIFEALLNRQPERAEFLLRDHIFINRDEMVGNFRVSTAARR